jgi:hypothetical protein
MYVQTACVCVVCSCSSIHEVFHPPFKVESIPELLAHRLRDTLDTILTERAVVHLIDVILFLSFVPRYLCTFFHVVILGIGLYLSTYKVLVVLLIVCIPLVPAWIVVVLTDMVIFSVLFPTIATVGITIVIVVRFVSPQNLATMTAVITMLIETLIAIPRIIGCLTYYIFVEPIAAVFTLMCTATLCAIPAHILDVLFPMIDACIDLDKVVVMVYLSALFAVEIVIAIAVFAYIAIAIVIPMHVVFLVYLSAFHALCIIFGVVQVLLVIAEAHVVGEQLHVYVPIVLALLMELSCSVVVLLPNTDVVVPPLQVVQVVELGNQFAIFRDVGIRDT